MYVQYVPPPPQHITHNPPTHTHTYTPPPTKKKQHLDGNVVDVEQADVVRDGLDPEHDPCGQGDEVAVEGLGDEGERPRRPEVALDHLCPADHQRWKQEGYNRTTGLDR